MNTRPKSRLERWIEDETGKRLEPVEQVAGNDRHVSLRIPTVVFDRLDDIAASRNETVSHTIRRMVSEALARVDEPDAAALDTAIAALQELRRRSA